MNDRKHYNLIVVGTFDCENFGDLLFPVVLETYLRNRGYEVNLYPFSPQECDMPFFEDRHVYSVKDMHAFLRSHTVDAIVIGGGDLIRLDSRIGKSYTDRLEANSLWTYPIILGNIMEIPVVFNCPGVPFEFNGTNQKLVKCLLDRVAYISVRDEYSKKYLQECNLNRPVTVSADTVAGVKELYPDDYIDTVFAALRQRISLPESEYMVIQINNSTFSAEQLLILKEFIERVHREYRYQLVFMPIGYEHDDDIALESLRNICDCDIVLPDSRTQKLSPEEMTAIIKHAAFFAGTSLHGAIVSYVYGTKFMEIMSGFSTKIFGFCKYIHAEHCIVNISDDLWASFARIRQSPLTLTAGEDTRIALDNHLSNMLSAFSTKQASDRMIYELLDLCSSPDTDIKRPKVYFDLGAGYNEQSAEYGDEITEKGEFHLRHNVESGCRSIRLDPVEQSCILFLDYAVCDKGVLSSMATNGLNIGTLYLFRDNDPTIEFPVAEGTKWIELQGFVFSYDAERVRAGEISDLINKAEQYGCSRKLHNVGGLVAELEDKAAEGEIAIKSLNDIINEKDVLIRSLNAIIDEKNAALNDVRAIMESLKVERDEKNTETVSLSASLEMANTANAALQDRVNMLEQSTCWKITKPLRVIVIGLRTVFSFSTYGRLLKKIYMALPMSTQSKLRLKGVLFKLFAPIIKNTTAYKDWKNYTSGANDSNVQASRIEIPDSEKQSFVEQIMNIPYTRDTDEYVAKMSDHVSVTNSDIKYLAFYLPQFHPFPENDKWWGVGFTEWTNVTKAVPQFTGHNQPRLAGELGYYDLRNKTIIRQQMDLAKQYGIYGFCIYFYWFDGKKLMDTPLNIIMNNEDLDLPFCLCWANENWSRKWDGKNQDILIAQNYDRDFPEKFISDVIPYMSDSRYIKIQGKPALIIYNANEIPDLKGVIQIWRDRCRSCGLGEIHLLAVDFALNSKSREAGFDGFVEFPPHSVYNYGMETINSQLSVIDSSYAGRIFDYGRIVREKKYLTTDTENYYKGIFLGWDNTARRAKNAAVYHRFTIAAFKEWIADITQFTIENRQKDDRFIFINAWNEWAEGTYLEPDRKYGYAALDAVRQVLKEHSNKKKNIIYVSHDACYNGAQLLSLHIIEQLVKVFHYDVCVILLRGGVLIDQFRNLSADFICLEQEKNQNKALLQWLKHVNCEKAMCNTVVSGDVLKILSEQGIHCISMIHEMEGIVKQYACEGRLANIAQYADKVVFASDYVRKSVEKIHSIPEDKIIISPQGSYKVNPYGIHNETNRNAVRRQFNLSENTQIALGVGFGDARKGIDLFVKTGIRACEQDPNLAFVWVGETDPALKPELDKILSKHPCRNRIIFAGATDDVFQYYSAADIFVLTSREDPFPTVVMEAMDAGLPVIAFQDGGGYVECVTQDTGILVAMESWEDMAEEICRLLADEPRKSACGRHAHEYASEHFNFIEYIYGLLSLLEENYIKVSVVVPNYNYGKYLKRRINSVLRQDYPVYELILLDDVSKDDSVRIMEQFARSNPLQIRLYQNAENSGNVFNQWEKGCRLATGEYVWIAEADDLAEPTFLSSIMAKIAADRSIVLGYSQSYMMDENGKVTANNYFCYTDDVDHQIWRNDYVRDAREEITKRLASKNTIPNVSAVVLKNRNFGSMFTEAKKFHVAGDWAFYVRLLEDGGKVAFVSQSLNYHRRHSNSVTTDLNAKIHFQEICKMQDYISSAYKDEVDREQILTYRKSVKETLGVQD
ncbi:MAG: glycoside hydrolase family 99-like domain-containing protein [Clostridium sp.]|nr:glycoside hydrolase family 99-like domain-containing protein [Acetatifactor muris]MCM1525807.1 glycoside hydrolase family 99-like domain-containing protein [Bacteroides sp.]MCM1564063.1 glycoside hydrolase family 99-like domain-containing protein [Clostridium sp.]